MRAFLLCFFLLVALYSVALAFPADDVLHDLETEGLLVVEKEHSRQKRFTCDVLGHWVGSSACAAHCIGHGRRGGYCNSQQVCVCR